MPFEQVLNSPLIPGAVVASTAALVDITPIPIYSLPANSLMTGMVLRVKAFGRYTTGSTATNCLIGVYYGGTGGVLLAGTLSTQALTVSLTNAPWELDYTFVVRGIGTSGSVWGKGWVDLGSSVSAVSHLTIPSTANAAVTVDTTVAKAINIGATLSQVTGSPTITCDHMVVEHMTLPG
jgi:hypothetical protein